MVEGEQKLCLAEPPLELMERVPLKVQMQLLEEMQDMEASVVEEAAEALVERVILIHLLLIILVLIDQEQMEAAAEREAMEAAVEQGALEGGFLTAIQG